MPPEDPGGEPEDPGWFDLTDEERAAALWELKQVVRSAEELLGRVPDPYAKPRYYQRVVGLRAAVDLLETVAIPAQGAKSSVSHA
jgi:hypothetical protein